MADRKISDLTALTAPAAGDYLPIVDISEVAAASKNKRITIEELFRGVPLGTAAAPSIAIEGDENTGIYSPGADQLAVATNGTGRLFVDASGNVGVSDSSPSTNSIGSGAPTIVLRGTSGATPARSAGLGFISQDGTSKTFQYHDAGIFYTQSTTATAQAWFTNNTERLRITSAGLVGVGTSTPNLPLTVAYSDTTAIPTSALADPATGALQIANTSDSAAYAGIYLRTRTTGSTNALIGLRYNSTFSDGDIFFRVRNGAGTSVEPLTIKASGNVGIGTTSPGGKLHVAGSTVLGDDGTNGRLTVETTTSTVGLFATTTAFGVYEDLEVRAAATIFKTDGSTERLRIDSSGRLLVGTSTARSNFFNTSGGVAPALQVEGSTSGPAAISITRNDASADHPSLILAHARGTGYQLVSSGDGLGRIEFQGGDGTEMVRAAAIQAEVDGTPGADDMPGRLVFSTTADGAASPTERMRITSTGNMLLGSAAAVYAAGERFSVSPASNTNGVGIALGNNNNVGIGIYHGYTATGTAIAMQFQDHNATVRGSITVTTSTTAYNTSSDYRLKENVAEVTDGITRLQQLKPSRFNFIADPDKTVDGFIAHEVQDIVPEAITGEKDAVDDDGNPVYQGIDQSKLVPLLTAALQEAIDEIESLKARVAALEAQ